MKFFKSYHSFINEVILDPWFIIGLTDAEGRFQVSVVKNSEYKLGWQSRVKFKKKTSSGGFLKICLYYQEPSGSLVELVQFKIIRPA